MKKIVLSTVAMLLCVMTTHAQELSDTRDNPDTPTRFTQRINDISYDIEVIVKRNKEELKEVLNDIEKRVENNELTEEEANVLKNEKAEFYAKKIEEEVVEQEDKIKKLINNKIENNINFGSDMSAYQKKLVENKVLMTVEYEFGHSTMLIDGKINNDYYWTNVVSSFGFSVGAKTRIGKDHSKIFWKSMLTTTFHSFKLPNHKAFENINNETVWIDLDTPAKKSRMNTVESKWSNYLEYDFSKKKYDEFGNPIIKSRQSFYVGAGGFIGVSQMNRRLVYNQNGDEYNETTNAPFNTNQFIYGVGAYAGYRNFSLRATYNVSDTFKRSFADHNIFTVSLVLELL